MIKRSIISLLLVFTLMMNTACAGPLSKMESLLPYAPTVVTALVYTGAIEEATGVLLKSDFNDGLAAFRARKNELDAVTDPNKKVKQAAIYSALANDWRLIVARNHFAQANNSKINTIVALITDIANLLANRMNLPEGARGIGDLDKTIEQKVNKLEKELKDK